MQTVAELRQEAKQKKIPGYYKMNKAELCRALGKGESCAKRASPSRSNGKGKTVKELKEELRRKNLSTTGNKAELIARLATSGGTVPVKNKPNRVIYLEGMSNKEKENLYRQPFIVQSKRFSVVGNSQTFQTNLNYAFENGEFPGVEELYLNPSFYRDIKTLPPEIGKFKNVKKLYLNGFNLTTLPPEIGELKKLEYLDLNNNSLRSLPPEIGKLKNLRKIRLHNNIYLHTLPKELASLPNLEVLEIDSKLVNEKYAIKSLPPEFFQPGVFPYLMPYYRKIIENYRETYFKEEEAQTEKETCGICLDKKANYVFNKCGHIVCGPCMKELKTKCPYCREKSGPVYYKDYKRKIIYI